MLYIRNIPVWLLMAGVTVGCSKVGPAVTEVRGTVTYQGKPVSQGTVVFTPLLNSSGELTRPGTGAIGTDGTFQMCAFPDRTGILPGKYQVAVNAYTGSFLEGNAVYIVPKRFANAVTSGLTATVPDHENGPIEVNFDLVD